jgi:glycerol-3-phosphate dehydrogenase
VIGGKLTGYRAIAEEVVDVAARQLGRAVSCTTSARPLPGASGSPGPEAASLQSQIASAVREQWCATLDDFLLRRSALGLAPDRGRAAVARVAEELQGLLGWSDARRDDEIRGYAGTTAIRDP